MERRFLPGTVPVFYIDPGSTFGENQAQTSSTVAPADDPTKSSETNTSVQGSGGGSTQGSIANYAIYVHQMQQDGSYIDHQVLVTESGQDSITATLPVATPSSGGSIQAVELQASFQNVDRVQTDAKGPYGVAGGPFTSTDTMGRQTSTVDSTSPFNMIVENTDGTASTGTITVSFSISISASTARFLREGVLAITSSYVDINTVGSTSGIAVYPHGSTTPLASDSNFANGPGSSSDLSFSYTGTFPIARNTSVSYTSQLISGPAGTFGGEPGGIGVAENTSNVSSLAWDFSLTANA